jgi:hypothetical protein
MYNSIINWHRSDGPMPLSELTDFCYALFLNGWTSMTAGKGKPLQGKSVESSSAETKSTKSKSTKGKPSA